MEDHGTTGRPEPMPGDNLPNAQQQVLDLLYGRWRSQTLYAGVKLGIFECVQRTPLHAAEIARRLDLDSALSCRLLSALGSLGLLQEHEGQLFAVTEAGELLRSQNPGSLSVRRWDEQPFEASNGLDN